MSWKYIDHRVKEFFAFLILLEFGLIGVFVALDLFLFFVFWEVSLVPMYFLIGIWGHERRIYATVKFFLYTMAGSVLMLAAIIYFTTSPARSITSKFRARSKPAVLRSIRTSQMLLFLAFFIAFAIKVPLFPLHTWLPDAHVEAPTAGSVMLASVMLKMGTYGLIRYCLPLFPDAAHDSAPWVAGTRDHRHHLRSPGRYGPAQHEKAGGVFLRQPPRIRRARNFFLHAAGAGRRRVPDAESRRLHRRAVHAGRLSL